MLRLEDAWLWDFWFARDGEDYHVFYLQAPRSLGNPDDRHWNASVGHAVSRDLRSWQVLPDALHPGPRGSFDDRATWTGSVIAHGGRWWMFYTGVSTRDEGLVQRIGLATSSDLMHWDKHPDNPLLTADARWYELLDRDVWHEQAWRDPWVFPDGEGFRMLVTARAKHGPADARGVVGQARSDDLVRWTVLEPLTETGEFGHMEVPQIVALDGRVYLIFSVYEWAHSERRLARSAPVAGTHYLVADDLSGPYRQVGDGVLHADAAGSRYAGKLIEGPEGWVFLAFSQYPDGPEFRGDLADPVAVRAEPDGRLTLAVTG